MTPTPIKSLLGNLQALLAPDALEAERARIGLEERAHEAARDRVAIRRERIVTAKIPIPDLDAIAAACLPAYGRLPDEPPPSEELAALDAALNARRLRLLPGRAPFVDTSSLRAVGAALRDRGRDRLTKPYVLILGAVGTGKTIAGAHGIASVTGGVYMRARKLCDLFGSFHRDDRAELARMHEAPLTVIDAIEEVPKTLLEKLGPALDEVFDLRQGARRITIVSGNMKPGRLGNMLAKSTVSRMQGRTDTVQVAENDMVVLNVRPSRPISSRRFSPTRRE